MLAGRTTLALKHLLAASLLVLMFAGETVHAQTDPTSQVRRLGLPVAENPTPEHATAQTKPANLKSRLSDQAVHNEQVRSAIAAKNWSGVLAVTPHRAATCPDDLDLWARGQALQMRGLTDELQSFYMGALASCSRPNARRLILESASFQLGEDAQLALLDQAAGLTLSPDVAAARDALRASAMRAQISRLLASSEWTEAFEIANRINDRDSLVAIGWGTLEANTRLARKSFEAAALTQASDEEARYGAALAAYQLGDLNPALAYRPVHSDKANAFATKGAQLAAMANLDAGERARASGKWEIALSAANTARAFGGDAPSRSDTLTGGILLDAAQAAYDAGNFEEARAYAIQAAAFPNTQRDGAMRAAWSDLQLERPQDAEQTFRELYRASPDAQSAEGLVLASARTGHVSALGPFAEQAGGPLADQIKTYRAGTAYAQKDFLLAEYLAPDERAELQGVDKFWVRQSLSSRNASGDPGEGQLEGALSRTSFGISHGPMEIEAGIAAFSYDAGLAPNAAPVGTPGLSNLTTKHEGAAPFLHFRREGDTRLDVRLATTPLDGLISATAVGQLSVERRNANHSWKATAFANSIDETLTSFTGREDAATGERWGRVVETGAKLEGRVDVRKDIALVGGVTAANLSGHNVEDNTHLQAQVGASKSFSADGFDYLAAGPFYQFDTYDQNTNFHTLGHGGYFSPQSFHRAGVSLNLQTDEARNWIARADLAVAYEDISTDSAPILPLAAPAGARFSSSKDSGIGAALEAQVARKISKSFTFSASASVIASKAYDDVRLGIALRYTPGGRARVLSRDLNPDPFNRDVW